ncbi:sugar ABC transporter permease [Vandammella animalimorsus]|uniref:Transport permease protein n=1 Tax=Vandammella animalimorsus TaxID=2029117 RepID=A0A2A2T844_9BURK|nr:ABC transporter permease [Vandammella animalimorsus]PAT33389.1 sugar ABC transporter permease [Vandammella animalimorsus]PAX18369.1 sugar ABC transporter permease [Vandammella animalimorsus]PAX20533.1 sugar ABC transporter permease [Vandammella animalimorsus]
MRNFSIAPLEMFSALWRNRELIMASTKREVLGRYRGSVMGLLWSFFNPLLMLTVYTFVFSVVFKARWNVETESKTEFALVLFAGLIVFFLFSETINRAPSLVVANVNYVKKAIFPLEILPVVSLLSALFHGFVSLCVWLIGYMLFFGVPQPTVLYLPLVILPLLLIILGLSWLLASLGVYLRDVSQFIGSLVLVSMFMAPIFYPTTAFPEEFSQWLYLNPLAPIVEQTRDVLYWGKLPDFELLGIYTLFSAFIAWLGFAWFQKTRKGFADVL